MRIVLIKNMWCHGYHVGESFEYVSETNTHYIGKTLGESEIKIPKHRAELDYQELIDMLNESIDIREGVKKLLDE